MLHNKWILPWCKWCHQLSKSLSPFHTESARNTKSSLFIQLLWSIWVEIHAVSQLKCEQCVVKWLDPVSFKLTKSYSVMSVMTTTLFFQSPWGNVVEMSTFHNLKLNCDEKIIDNSCIKIVPAKQCFDWLWVDALNEPVRKECQSEVVDTLYRRVSEMTSVWPQSSWSALFVTGKHKTEIVQIKM